MTSTTERSKYHVNICIRNKRQYNRCRQFGKAPHRDFRGKNGVKSHLESLVRHFKIKNIIECLMEHVSFSRTSTSFY